MYTHATVKQAHEPAVTASSVLMRTSLPTDHKHLTEHVFMVVLSISSKQVTNLQSDLLDDIQ